ncbi:type I secretion system permease/ATPase [Bradyrhizobium sp. SZCCHNS2002]|uniref:type I secretion system permease/ATPase n=1 Tax=Bradyrhizobium sp. SZCCHNS2002 TaxID=3057302 RepID=UPI0029169B44|nr:type I secretion system permease/ATPase [Bradyrhizobium sp. SZCCHNS2002]
MYNTPGAPNVTSTADSGLACVVLIARFYERPVNPQHLVHELSTALLQPEDILKAFKLLDLKARLVEHVEWERLEQMPLPALVQRKSGSWTILGKVNQGKILLQDPAAQKPVVESREAFLESFSGKVVLVTRRAGLQALADHFDVRWFIPEILRYRRLFGEVLLASLFIQVVALISPIFFQVVVDKVLVHQGWRTLDVLVFGLIVVSLFDATLNMLRSYVLAHTTSRIDVTLGARLFQHLLNLPLAYFQARRIGDTVARVRELETIRNFLTGSTLTAVLDAVFVVVFLGVMFWYSPLLTWIVIGSIPLYVALCVLVAPVLRARVQEKFRRGADNQAFLVESVNGIETIKSSAIEPQMRRRWEEQLAAYVQTGFRAGRLGTNAGQAANLINKITMALVLWFGAREVMDNSLTVGMLVAFNMLSGQVTAPILRLAQLWQDFQQVGVSVERLGDVLNTRTEVASSASQSHLPAMKGDITLEHVTFRYQPDTAAVLDNVSLTIKAGEVVGLVGPSGSGKSTITKLIQRLYVPERGRVLIDGVDMARLEPSWLRRQTGVVLQENFLFNRTIRENIALANPGVRFEEVQHAAELAGAHEFIIRLPDGYETMVGERGSTLSGGQKQRLAIARALLTDPKLLILDEATSALDYESESIIQGNMDRICKGRTVIIIAHRLSTVLNTDRIFVIDKGRLVESGTHDELVKMKGVYRRLHNLQAGTPARTKHAA